MTRTFQAAIAATLLLAGAASSAQVSPAYATSRIKDLANVEGVRQNQLIGYGLVVGLNGTGDTLNNIPFTRQSLQAMLERLGVNIRGQTLRTGNVAAVMVTGNLPAFATQGTRLDVSGVLARRWWPDDGDDPAGRPCRRLGCGGQDRPSLRAGRRRLAPGLLRADAAVPLRTGPSGLLARRLRLSKTWR